MSACTHPKLGPIAFMPHKICPKKVWRHFYSPREHWEHICGADVGAMRGEAEAIVGTRRDQGDSLPFLDPSRWGRAKALLVAHHDGCYKPAYAEEMSASGTVWTGSMDAGHRHRALTPNSVFIVVQLDQPRSWVVTAFRPHPDVEGVDFDEDGFRRHATLYFARRTGMKVDEFAHMVVESLLRSSTPPSTASALWWLVSAVGYGRLLSRLPSVADALPAAEKALSETDHSVLEQLRGSLGWDSLRVRLAEALKEPRPEEFEAVLADAEELLAVAGAVGADLEAESFCNGAEMLIPWLPVEWAFVGTQARERLQTFADESGLVQRLWSAVDDASTSALEREAEPTVRPASRLVDRLIPQQSRWPAWRERLSRFRASAGVVVEPWIDRTIGRLSLAPLAPAMGSAEASNDEWVLSGYPSPGAPYFRVFVVDAEHPDGVEVTEQCTENDGDLWRLGANERCLVVIVAGDEPVTGFGLGQVLDFASERHDVAARAQEFQPTQTTNARR